MGEEEKLLELMHGVIWYFVVEQLNDEWEVEVAPNNALYVSGQLSKLTRETEECLRLTRDSGGCYEIWRLEFINAFLVPFEGDYSFPGTPTWNMLRRIVGYLNDVPDTSTRLRLALMATRLIAGALSAFATSPETYYDFVEHGILPKWK